VDTGEIRCTCGFKPARASRNGAHHRLVEQRIRTSCRRINWPRSSTTSGCRSAASISPMTHPPDSSATLTFWLPSHRSTRHGAVREGAPRQTQCRVPRGHLLVSTGRHHQPNSELRSAFAIDIQIVGTRAAIVRAGSLLHQLHSVHGLVDLRIQQPDNAPPSISTLIAQRRCRPVSNSG